jgi:hypothetical protein
MISGLSHLRLHGGLVPAVPSSVLEPLWVQVAALLPTRQVHHPLGCHRPRIPDRVVFDKLVQVLVFGCGYRRIADRPARRRPCGAAATSGSPPAWPNSCTWRYWPPTTACTAWSWSTWRWMGASPRRPAVARPPAQARWTAASRGSSAQWPLTRAASRWGGAGPCHRRDDGLLVATLDALGMVGPARPTGGAPGRRL